MRPSASLLVRSAALLLLGGCFISTSISTSVDAVLGSVSNALNSISDSISTGGGESAMYLRDVKMYAATYLREPNADADFARGLSLVAESHGVVHWEASAETFVAVGDGLRLGGASPEQMERMVTRLGQTDAERARLLLDGYRRAER